ncbi:hypothetical protein Pryu01_00718 [Paraliobacillus ryukyuensis]|uniref:Uncharacterized protein n=1 Tax=Paraliobacillus ryukyuensis TaxID=200904 RepID=A0A366EEG2_9BACI|nr:hypothetical protein [Paraliobacillus ryukyuensis]RBP00708.1 hypothetical protein DES48_102476 [Paraliobacillus ryukyuensis]
MARRRIEDGAQHRAKKQTASATELLRYANKNSTIPFDWSKLNK